LNRKGISKDSLSIIKIYLVSLSQQRTICGIAQPQPYLQEVHIMAQEKVEIPISGKIVAVHAKVGAKVKEGDPICILESMKMENPILSPATGTVKEIKVSVGQAVKTGDVLAIIET
jgi:biotin carboxyl carrier protein